MRAKNEGTIERRNGRPYAVLLSVPGQVRRTRLRLPKGSSEAFAEEKRALWSGLLAAGKLVPHAPEAEVPAGETFADWADRWLEHRKTRGIGTVSDDRSRLKQHVTPLLGAKVMAIITADELEAVRDALDTRIREGSLSAGTARNVWCNVTSMFRDAARSKTRELRVRSDNPATDLEGPDTGDEKPGPFLYPSEFLQLMRCSAVPIAWRQLVALAVYLGQRASELRALLPSDVDLAHHQVAVTKKRRKKSGPTEAPKTRQPAFPDIEPTLEPLLKHLVEHPAGDGGQLVWTAQGTLASTFRSQLRRAGLTRTELVSDTPTTRAITFHDLRHTCATWMSVRGQSAWAIMGRTGHKNLGTVQRYVDQWARKNEAHFGEVFPPLPPELWGELSTESVHEDEPCENGSQKQADDGGSIVNRTRYKVQKHGANLGLGGSEPGPSTEGNPAISGDRRQASGQPEGAAVSALLASLVSALRAGDRTAGEAFFARLAECLDPDRAPAADGPAPVSLSARRGGRG